MRLTRFMAAIGGLAMLHGCGGGASLSNRSVPHYKITDLGQVLVTTPVCSINNSGQVVCTAGDTFNPGSSPQAFVYQNGKTTPLGGSASASYARGINNAGQIAGRAILAGKSSYHAVLYQNGATTDLGTLGGNSSDATAINNIGQVVGVSDTQPPSPMPSLTPTPSDVFLYSQGRMTDLGVLTGYNQTVPYAVNDAGQIVGQAQSVPPSTPSTLSPVAFLYSNGRFTQLPSLGGVWSTAYAINNNGQIVGQSSSKASTSDPGFFLHAVLWRNGQILDLGTLPGGNHSLATAINSTGTIVGGSSTASNFSDLGFVYQNGRMTDLNTTIPTNSGWLLYGAHGINDSGWIVGVGKINSQFHAYLLTPDSGAGAQ